MRSSRRSLKTVHELVHDSVHDGPANVLAVQNAGEDVRVALNDLHVEARANERARERLERYEPSPGVPRVLFNRFLDGMKHAELVDNVPCGVVN